MYCYFEISLFIIPMVIVVFLIVFIIFCHFYRLMGCNLQDILYRIANVVRQAEVAA